MNPRILPLVALLAAVAAAAYFFLSLSTPTATDGAADAQQAVPASGKARPAGGAGKNSVSGDSSESIGKKPAMNWRFLAALMNSSGESGAQIPESTAEDIARFLAKRGETPANLVAAFGKTRDRRLLERALELFPNSPIVLMTAIESVPASPDPQPGETYQMNAQRMAFIERFKAADPNNPLPWIFSAQEFSKSGQTADAVADIRAALGRPAFYIYASERMDSAQHLYEDLGLHPIHAGVLAMAGMTLPHMSAANQTSRSLMEWQKSATGSGDTAAADEALRLSYDLGHTFATPEASRTLIGQLVGIAMEQRAIEALPAGAQPGWLAGTPTQRLAEIASQKQSVRDLIATSDWLYRSADEQLWAEYLRRNRSDGEFSALTWLKTQKK